MQALIERNLIDVRRRISEAAERSGRTGEDVKLVAVTKYRSWDEVRALVQAGQRVLGENRVREIRERMSVLGEEFPEPALEWHFIGHLQTNKAKKIAGRVSLIHGVDSYRLAETLQREAEKRDLTIDLLLQANIAEEESKFGLSPEEIETLARDLKPLDRLRCVGLMTMAPYEYEPERTRPVFRGLRELRDRIARAGHDHLDMRHLSMGMTNDFEVAVEEGATIVRVGTALFEEQRRQSE